MKEKTNKATNSEFSRLKDICVHVRVCIHAGMTCMSVCILIHVSTFVYVCACVCMCMRVRVHACRHVCVCGVKIPS